MRKTILACALLLCSVTAAWTFDCSQLGHTADKWTITKTSSGYSFTLPDGTGCELAFVEQVTPISPIQLINAGFEEPVLPEDGFTTGSAPGWEGHGQVGAWNPRDNYQWFNGPLPGGEQVGYANYGGLTQQTEVVITRNTTYTLTVDIGRRNDVISPAYEGDYGVRLKFLDENDNVLAYSPPSPVVDAGTWEVFSFSFTTGNDGPEIGRKLKIFVGSVWYGYGPQVNFDNVRLSIEAAQ